MFKVQKRACSTCIYRSDSPLDLKALEAQVAVAAIGAVEIFHKRGLPI
jgi:hypothetical protein